MAATLPSTLCADTVSQTARHTRSFADPARLLAAAHDLGLEGVVSERLDAPYRSGRRPEWVKVKIESWRIAKKERWRLFEMPLPRGR
ncbi:MAG: hypothetical protein WAN86_10935 [Hyphomicrobiaceae bacterium]